MIYSLNRACLGVYMGLCKTKHLLLSKQKILNVLVVGLRPQSARFRKRVVMEGQIS